MKIGDTITFTITKAGGKQLNAHGKVKKVIRANFGAIDYLVNNIQVEGEMAIRRIAE